MRALITNDDGIQSPGLHALAAVAVEAGLEVVVAAPDGPYSGSSAALTALREDGRFPVHDTEIPVEGLERSVAVAATPAFIVMAAMTGAFGPAPGVVLSGVNLGPNTGHATLHSGTVGAALTAAIHACPAVAVSLAAPSPTQFGTAAQVSRRVLDWVLAHEVPTDLALNVNVPDVPPERLRGLRTAGLAEYGAVQANVAETGKGFVSITYQHIEAEYEADTDAALVLADWATVTALAGPSVDPAVDLGALEDVDTAEAR